MSNTTFLLYLDRDEKERAREAAKRAEQSLAAWIRVAIREKNAREQSSQDEE